jgi:hypothetical protein
MLIKRNKSKKNIYVIIKMGNELDEVLDESKLNDGGPESEQEFEDVQEPEEAESANLSELERAERLLDEHGESMGDKILNEIFKYIEVETFMDIFFSIILFILSMAIHNSETYKIVGEFGSKIPQIKSLFKGNTLVGVHSLLLAIVFYLVLRYFPVDYMFSALR